MRVIVVTSNAETWRYVSEALARIGIESSRCSTVEDCGHTFRHETIDLALPDERVSDGDHRDIFGPGRYSILYPVDSPKT